MVNSDLNPLRSSLESGNFTVTAEITPPRSASFKDLEAAAKTLKNFVNAINLPDGARARARISSLAASIFLKQMGIEPVMQVTCRDRNRIAIQSDLLGAAAFGIRNVLSLTGDNIDAGDDPDAKSVFDLDSRGLIKALESMNNDGVMLSGSKLEIAPDYFPGAADTPHDPAHDWVPSSLISKYKAGARFVQTQYCYDMEVLGRYMHRLADHGLTEKLFFLVGLGPLRSANAASWMRDNLYGTIIPDTIIARLQTAKDPRIEGIEICAELMAQASETIGISGVHLMASNQYQEIVEAIKISGKAHLSNQET
jgi:methylenetetrahydrofolate reductase (NADPH)